MDVQPQQNPIPPNFATAEHHLHGLAVEMRRCENLPAMADGVALQAMAEQFQNLNATVTQQFQQVTQQFQQVTQQLQQLTQQLLQVNQRLDRADARNSAMYQNGFARLINNRAFEANHPLEPLRNVATNEAIPNFPQTLSQVNGLTLPQAGIILRALELGDGGLLPERLTNLRRAIGLSPA